MTSLNLLDSYSKKLLEKMDKKHLREVKGYLGVTEIACNIVEESYRRLKKTSSSVEKKDTAIRLINPVLAKLKQEGFVNDFIEEKIRKQLESQNLEDTIDDIIISWKERAEKVRTCCFQFRRISSMISKELTKLEKIKFKREELDFDYEKESQL